eukprot:gnl/MRDRNA2_/MRDRNA2_147997_c0_seq1.p1 gnl/MRDRNA2_/MRDRNA2_147997_c0~~gnl/MRDRNA2_/MRDRNA2_147997_c0_seq1.p1  ORF type:complete len:572 (-),score=102.71 gnl/MRDRNA2_/MRDRNA2_147997_c0_seq1:16-1731(-)
MTKSYTGTYDLGGQYFPGPTGLLSSSQPPQYSQRMRASPGRRLNESYGASLGKTSPSGVIPAYNRAPPTMDRESSPSPCDLGATSDKLGKTQPARAVSRPLRDSVGSNSGRDRRATAGGTPPTLPNGMSAAASRIAAATASTSETGMDGIRSRSVDAASRSRRESAVASNLAASSGSSLLGGGNAKHEDDSSAAAEYADRFLAGYDKIRLLGTGACAAVWLAAPQGRSGLVAIKQVAKGNTGKKKADTDSARKELAFGQQLFPGGVAAVSEREYPGIRHIAKLLDAVETKRDLWLVQEFGGTCLTKACFEIKGEFVRGERLYRVVHQPLMQAMRRNPVHLKRAVKQLMQALCLLADSHMVHSDIKPENILVDEDEKGELTCRFIDFGSSFSFDHPESLALATPEYMPPEALETCAGRFAGGSSRLSMGRVRNPGVSNPRHSQAQDSSRKSVTDLFNNSEPWSFDIWSMGSIILELALGAPLWLPYKCVAGDSPPHTACPGLFSVPGRDPEKIVVKQTDALLNRGLRKVLRDPPGVPLDSAGLDLLERMLCWTAADRISPAEVLKHPWLHGV